MYPEFVAIYVGLAIALALLITILILLIVILKRGNGATRSNYHQNISNYQNSNFGGSAGIVFCRKCSTQYDGATRICPRCGTPR